MAIVTATYSKFYFKRVEHSNILRLPDGKIVIFIDRKISIIDEKEIRKKYSINCEIELHNGAKVKGIIYNDGIIYAIVERGIGSRDYCIMKFIMKGKRFECISIARIRNMIDKIPLRDWSSSTVFTINNGFAICFLDETNRTYDGITVTIEENGLQANNLSQDFIDKINQWSEIFGLYAYTINIVYNSYIYCAYDKCHVYNIDSKETTKILDTDIFCLDYSMSLKFDD